MSFPFLQLLLLAIAYTIGSIPFSVYLVRWATGRDVRTAGSGNPGATNALRIAGPKVGLLTLLCDVLKGVLPVVAAKSLAVGSLTLGGVAVAVVLGHVYSMFLGFRGGKGVATGAGALGALQPPVLIGVVLLFVVVLIGTRYVSVASVAGALSFSVLWFLSSRLGWTEPPGPELLLGSVFIGLLVAVQHRSNFSRIRRGAERRLGELRVAEGDPLDDQLVASADREGKRTTRNAEEQGRGSG